MNAQQLLTKINEVRKTEIAANSRQILDQIAADLEAEIRYTTSHNTGRASALRIVNSLLKGVRKGGRTSLHYAWTDTHNRQCVCDGYRAYRLNDPLPLEPRPDDCGTPIDLDKLFPGSYTDYDLIDLPSAADVKAHIALEKANGNKKGILYDCGWQKPVFNAVYLLELLELFPEAKKAFVLPGQERIIKPMFVVTERGDAILLPIRSKDHYRKTEQFATYKLIREYKACLAKDPEYGMTPEQFAELIALTPAV